MPRPPTDPWHDPASTAAGTWLAQAERWGRDHLRVSKESLSQVSGRLPTSLLVWLLIGIALALPGCLYLLQVNLTAMAAQWQGRPGITVYMQVGASADVARALADDIGKDPAVARIVVVTADDALREFQQYAGVADALAHLGTNPLPASLRIALVDGTKPAQFDALAGRVKGASGVDQVAIERTWLERLEAMTGVVRRIGWMLAGLFALGAVLVTATSVRLAIEGRLAELRVVKLVGGSDAYVRRPFLYLGLLYGLGGGLAAAMLISAGLVVIEPPLAALVGSYGTRLEIVGLSPLFYLGLLALGGGLGICGAVLAARQRLRGLEVV
jgi:cell division transport system permease protein